MISKASISVWRLILLLLFAGLNLSPSPVNVWGMEQGELVYSGIAALSSTSNVINPPLSAEIKAVEFTVNLDEGRAIARYQLDGRIKTWQSPDAWRVDEAFFSDLNRDGIQELSLLVWRAYKPWPVDQFLHFKSQTRGFHNDRGLSCQLILMKWEDKVFKEAWAGSALAAPLHDLQVADLDGDGYQELAALEQVYDAGNNISEVVTWRWNGFGFSLDSRLEGLYSNISVIQDQEKSWLVIQ